MCVSACVCVCVRARVRVRACIREYVCVRARAGVIVCKDLKPGSYPYPLLRTTSGVLLRLSALVL